MKASRLAPTFNMTPQEWQNVHLASTVQKPAVEANVLPRTYNARHEAPVRVSHPLLDTRLFILINILVQHSHPARDMGLSWKHHSRYARGSSL